MAPGGGNRLKIDVSSSPDFIKHYHPTPYNAVFRDDYHAQYSNVQRAQLQTPYPSTLNYEPRHLVKCLDCPA